MNTKKPFYLELLTGIHTFLICIAPYPLIAGLCGLQAGDFVRFHALCLLLFIPILCSRFLIVHLKHLIPYLILSLALCAGIFYAAFYLGDFFPGGNQICGILTFCLSLFIFWNHAYARISYGKMKRDFQAMPGTSQNFPFGEWEISVLFNIPSPVHWVWFALLYVAALFLKNSIALRILFFLTLADIVVWFLYHYSYTFYRFVRDNHTISNLPQATMKQVHKILGVVAVLFLAVFVLPALLYAKEPLESLSFENMQPDTTMPPQMEPPINEMPAEIPDGLEDLETKPAFVVPGWLRTLASAFLYLVLLAAAAAVLLAIFRAVQNAGKAFAVEEDDEILFLNVEDVNERTDSFAAQRRKDGWLSANARIRRRYKKRIQKATAGTPNTWATPTELEQNAGLTQEEDMRILHEDYEKARYSKEGVR